MYRTDGPFLEAMEQRLLLSGDLPVQIDIPAGDLYEGAPVSLTSQLTDYVQPVGYVWSVNGQQHAPSSEPDFTFTPGDNADYLVRLTVTDGTGATGWAEATVSVLNVAPAVSLPSAGGGGLIGLVNGSFDNGLGAEWQPGPLGVVEADYGYLHMQATSQYEWGGWYGWLPVGEPQSAIVDYFTPLYAYAPGSLTYAPAGADGLSFQADVTVQGLPEGYPETWLIVYAEYSDVYGHSGLSAGLWIYDGDPDTYTIAMPDLDHTKPVYIWIYTYTEEYPEVEPPFPNEIHTVTIDVEMDNFAWHGTSSGGQTVPEGAPVTLSATVTDPGLADTFTYAWSVNGQPYATTTVPNLTFTPPDNGTYIVSVTVMDDDGGVSEPAATTIEATNVAPAVSIVGLPTVPEGAPVTLSASVTDPGLADTFTYVWSLDDQAFDPTDDPTFTFTPPDNGTYVVSVTVTDDDGGISEPAVTSIEATNAAPVVTIVGPAHAVRTRGEEVAFVLHAADAPADQASGFTYRIDWGDGTVETRAGSDSLTVTHIYEALGTYAVSAVATDKDGGSSEPAAASAEIVRARTEGGLLRVVGSAGADAIHITGGAAIVVAIDEDGDGVADWSATYDAAAISRIVLYGGAGDDKILIDPDITLPAELYGGDGNDVLQGGGGDDLIDGGDGDDELIGCAGDDVIFGRAGNDQITGGSGDDFLVGGDGSDRLVGSAGHDILVAGEMAPSYTVAELRAILANWVGDRTPDDALVDDAQNDELVSDDDYDSLTGGSGSDWFIISFRDKVTDFKQNKTQEDLITEI